MFKNSVIHIILKCVIKGLLVSDIAEYQLVSDSVFLNELVE